MPIFSTTLIISVSLAQLAAVQNAAPKVCAEIWIDRSIGRWPEQEGGACVTPTSVCRAIEWARSSGITDIILRFKSGGGGVDAAKEIQACIVKHQPAMKFHARIERAISACIWLAFACDDIWMEPGSAFGGAVAFATNHSTGAAEVDAKMNSILAAEVCTIAAKNGHSPAVVKAMMLMPSELWATTSPGSPSPTLTETPESSASRCIDKADTILTLSESEAVSLGIARRWADAPVASWGEVTLYPQAMREIDRLFKGKDAVQGAFLADGRLGQRDTTVIELGQQRTESPAKMREAWSDISLRKWPPIKRLIDSVYANDPCRILGGGRPAKQVLDEFRSKRRAATSNWKSLVVAIAYLRKDFPSAPAIGQMPPSQLVDLWDIRERELAAAADLVGKKP